MKNLKALFLICFLAVSFLMPNVILGFTFEEVVNHQAPETYFYPQEFDKLVLDVTLPSGREDASDTLLAIVLQNHGTARNTREITKMFLWKDALTSGFQGMGIDEELGQFTFYSDNSSWYLDGLEVFIPAEGLRVFVTVETYKSSNSNTTLHMKISPLQDQNQNKSFNIGDLGVYLESQNNGPEDNYVLNTYRQTMRTFYQDRDSLAPKSVIVDPEGASVALTDTSYKVLGKTRDQGGSTPQWVKIGINDQWHDVTPTDSNYINWEYEWEDISEGTYILKTKSADFFDNTETPGEGVEVVMASEIEEEEPEEEPEEEEEEEEEPEEEEQPIKEMTIEELKEKIAEVQQMIIDLLNQLIQLVQDQIGQL